MRVAVVAEWYPSPVDPVHGIWAHRQALATRDAGAEVRVLAARRPIPPLSAIRGGPLATAAWLRGTRSLVAPFEMDGLTVTPVPWASPPRPLSYGAWGHWLAPPLGRALSRLHAAWPFDVVHAHNVTPPGYAVARWIAAFNGVRPALAVSTHGPDVISVHERSRVAGNATRRTLHAADVVIANSRWAAARCEDIAGKPLPVALVHLGADVPTAAAERLPRTTIVTLAHLVTRKRHAVVLRALAALPPDRRPDYLVIGDGPALRPLEALAQSLGVADRVTFHGQLDHADALRELARGHLFVMPGVEEPFGVAYVEAMAAGLPAIGAASEGGPQDIAAAGEGMVLVPVDDVPALTAAIDGLLGDPGRLAALGAAARATVERSFTWAACGAHTVAAYEQALGRAREVAQ
jgi:glycosyltransferase involved in cell wall biosynthesis